MSTPPSSSANEARQALGARLREIRQDAGLSGRALAAATGPLMGAIAERYRGRLQLIAVDNYLSNSVLIGVAQSVVLTLSQADRLIRIPAEDNAAH